jgi:hypothetical protein
MIDSANMGFAAGMLAAELVSVFPPLEPFAGLPFAESSRGNFPQKSRRGFRPFGFFILRYRMDEALHIHLIYYELISIGHRRHRHGFHRHHRGFHHRHRGIHHRRRHGFHRRR